MRKLTAIMFTDMVGYTKLMQEDEQRAKSIRDRHRSVLRTSIEKHHGEIIQFYGDGTLSIFGSAVEGVAAAVEIQHGLQTEPPIPVRIGLHIGDIIHDQDGVYGDGVNVAARIQGMAISGSVVISGKVCDEVKNHPEFPVAELGEFELKNVKRPMRLFAIQAPGLTVPAASAMRGSDAMPKRTIAVLPFVNMSADPENEHFSDGITEELINALAKVRGLRVTARTSSFAFKGRNEDVRKIGAELGVNSVLEGSVRKAGDRVRITAQLVDTRDGYHIFSHTYDEVVEDIFKTQDEISLKIADELRATLPGAPRQGRILVQRPTKNGQAYDLYLKGLYNWKKWTPDDVVKAVEYFREAIDLDPEFALAYSGMANCYTYLGAIGHLACGVAYPQAKRAAQHSIELNPDIAESHLALALVRLFYAWNLPAARSALEKALSINPGHAEVHQVYSLYFLAAGEIDELVESAETAQALDPLSLVINEALGRAYVSAGRHGDALAQFDRTLELDPEFRAAVEGKGVTYMEMGDLGAAIAQFERFRELSPHPQGGVAFLAHAQARAGNMDVARELLAELELRERNEPHMSLDIDFMVAYSGMGMMDEAFDRLERAIEERLGSIIFLKHGPLFAPLREDPRFAEVMERLGLNA
ncbi:MAG: adenylate/guanylate cyclase domain-containing protein [Gemmatimonadota bacterium]|nr:MAG: adenylate/guanylate cyclase domain-containing protein [Gemmatimonadota bacterium]